MKNLGVVIGVCLALAACKNDSYFKMRHNTGTKQLLATSTSKRYYSQAGDTVLFKVVLADNGLASIKAPDGANSSLLKAQNLESEYTSRILKVDTLIDYELLFTAQTFYDETAAQLSSDSLQISLNSDSLNETSRLNLVWNDSLNCLDNACYWLDSLNLLDATFTDVFATGDTALAETQLYVNKTLGVVGFKLADGRTYQLISN